MMRQKKQRAQDSDELRRFFEVGRICQDWTISGAVRYCANLLEEDFDLWKRLLKSKKQRRS